MNGTSIKNLSFSYPGDTRLILKDIDLEVEAGEFVCLLGQSGCGKSTFLRYEAALRHCPGFLHQSPCSADGRCSVRYGLLCQEVCGFRYVQQGLAGFRVHGHRHGHRDAAV